MRTAKYQKKCFICGNKLKGTNYTCERCWISNICDKLVDSIPDYIPVEQEFLYLKTKFLKFKNENSKFFN